MRGEASEFPFVPTPTETAGFGGKAVCHRNAVAARMGNGQPPVIAVEASEAAGLERTNAVAYIVAYAIPRINERIVPIRVEQPGQAMRLMEACEIDWNSRPKRLIAAELCGLEQSQRVCCTAPLAQYR